MSDTDVRLEAGSVVALRMYDLARAVDLDALAQALEGDSERPQFPSGPTAGLRYGRAPLEFPLDDVEVPLEDGRVFADVTARVFDFGIAVVALRVLVGGMDWYRFTERVDDIAAAVSGEARAWKEVEERVRQRLRQARLRIEGDAVGRHVFVIARRFGEPIPVDELIDEDYAAAIVSRDWLPLTSLARGDLLRGARAVGTDLLVTGEDRTFIVEAVPGGGLPDAVEAALAQRACYDRVLASLDGLGAQGRRQAFPARARFDRADALLGFDRAGRLAGVYATARDRFRVGEVGALADRRLAAAGAAAGRAALPMLPLIVVAVLAAVATALVFLVLG